VINPTFSAAKLRLMSSLVNHCIQSLMDKLKNMEEKGAQFNIYEMYRRLTMDVICKYFYLETFVPDYLRKE
jgi:cytochrome P450